MTGFEVDMDNEPGMAGPGWTAKYTGDSVYQGSTVSGFPAVPSCDPNQAFHNHQEAKSRASQSLLDLSPVQGKVPLTFALNSTTSAQASATPALSKLSVPGPKFTPPLAIVPAVQQGNGLPSPLSSSAESQGPSACIASLQPAVSFSPGSLTFASTNFGSTSASQTLTVTNTGSSAMTVKSYAFTGTNASAFELTGKPARHH
jgi:hypothetical protein